MLATSEKMIQLKLYHNQKDYSMAMFGLEKLIGFSNIKREYSYFLLFPFKKKVTTQ